MHFKPCLLFGIFLSFFLNSFAFSAPITSSHKTVPQRTWIEVNWVTKLGTSRSEVNSNFGAPKEQRMQKVRNLYSETEYLKWTYIYPGLVIEFTEQPGVNAVPILINSVEVTDRKWLPINFPIIIGQTKNQIVKKVGPPDSFLKNIANYSNGITPDVLVLKFENGRLKSLKWDYYSD